MESFSIVRRPEAFEQHRAHCPIPTAPPLDAVAADEFTTRLGSTLIDTDDAIFHWLALGQPTAPILLPSQVRPDDVPIQLPPRSAAAGGTASRAKGAPASDVLGPLTEFLDAHRDEHVIVEWRVQE